MLFFLTLQAAADESTPAQNSSDQATEMTDAEVNDAKAYLLQSSSKSGINL